MPHWRLPRSVTALAALAGLLTVCAGFQPALDATGQTSTEWRRQAFEHAYNLDHDEAMALLRKAIASDPNDPAAHWSLASVLWLNMLFRKGAVTVDHYLGSFSRARVDMKAPPPELDAEFRRHVERAIALAEQRVSASPRDPRALYDLGAALGFRASYIATVEGKLLGGFKAARRAFDAHEKVLDLDPSRVEAGLVVGTYRYIVSTLSPLMRMMAYVAGFGGGRDRGIEFLKAAAGSRTEASTDAMFALVLVYNRERRYDEALRILDDLRREYPRNRLVVLEAGSTALRAGRHEQADALLTDGLGMLARETRPRMPGEEALWRYKRGTARAALGQTDAALEDLRAAAGPDGQAWVTGRARVELGRIALSRRDSQTAAAEAKLARTLCEQGNDPECVEQARKLLRNANVR